MASMQQGATYGYDTGFSYSAYRSHMQTGIRLGGCLIGAQFVPIFCFMGFGLMMMGTIMAATSTDSYFGTNTTTLTLGIIFLVIGLVLIVGSITLACVAYQSFKNTQVATPGQTLNPPGGAYLQGTSMPFSGAGTSAYSSVNTQGAGFSSQYNYSPSPGFSGEPGGTSHPPPQPGFLGQVGSSPYQPPPGFSGQPDGASFLPPPPAYSEKPGIDPPHYDSSIPSAPKM